MTEENLFNLINKEKKNIDLVSESNINNFYCKYYLKSLIMLKNNFETLKNDTELEKNININLNHIFENNIERIGGMINNIFWIIFLHSFNIHITIFFIQRATLLFYEFISLSLKEKNYIVETKSYINDAIIFTYKKTIENKTLESIEEEHQMNKKSEFFDKYQKILKVRKGCYIISKIINKIIVIDFDYIENNKNNKELILLIFNIYQNINIDKYLFFTFNKLLKDYELPKSLFIIRIITETINDFINLNFFDFNNTQEDINNFVQFLNINIKNFINNKLFDDISYNTNEIQNKKTYINFKETMLRYINI